ncbi:MAG: shikimate dehydrogenase [Methanomicrobiales archaeon]|jgi:shikimate dehydrogenase|nr:shikimate dehydrogenase [Methanomicrobiales archaeon]MDD1711121.1 shikimate dehydrogenase [Methanoregulaceae archaeon]
MRVVLIGFRGTGKTETGRLLSRLTAVPFLDTDAMIEASAGMTIHEIFHREGEEGFRAREREVIRALSPGDAVIGTGGGAILDPVNVALLRKGSTMVLLEADEAVIEKRIAASTRPPLTTHPLREEIHELLELRRPLYAAAADFRIDTSLKSQNEVVLVIRKFLDEGTVPRQARESLVSFLEGSGIPDSEVAEARILTDVDLWDPRTRLYAIAGYPATQSRSPLLFNRLFKHYGLSCHYLRFQDPDLSRILRLADETDLRGLSVTIPFKQEILSTLTDVEVHANAIGAVNTVVRCGTRRFGYNTDWIGIREPLSDHRGEKAVVLGAGGAAAAAVYALLSLDMEVTILNRTVEKAASMAERFGCSYGPPSAFDRLDPAVVVNATPVGMEPELKSPLQKHQLRSTMTVFDLVYTPPETPLLRIARNSRCQTIPGTEMFVRQAAAQFRHFTGIAPPLDLIRSAM